MKLEPADLAAIADRVADEIERRIELHNTIGGALAYREPEAAGLIGISQHALRDARYRGDITASRVGRCVIYSVDELKRFLKAQMCKN